MSPEPWLDATNRLKAAALVAADRIEWPNEPFVQPDLSTDAAPLWLSVEGTADIAVPIEMGGGGWQEEGRLFVHVLAARGTGTLASRNMAKAVSNVFRGIGPNATIYVGASIGAGEAADAESTTWRLTVVIDYRYTDTT